MAIAVFPSLVFLCFYPVTFLESHTRTDALVRGVSRIKFVRFPVYRILLLIFLALGISKRSRWPLACRGP